ncbi:MAG: extracellular solute-binding protein [Candidatus Omnitrophota bacterium]
MPSLKFKTQNVKLKPKTQSFLRKTFNFKFQLYALRLQLYTFCALSLVILISGCGGGGGSSGQPKATITAWHWMTDRDSIFNELAERYEEKTGVAVKFELYAPSDSYTQKVRAAAQAGTLPDIYGLLAEKRDFASFIIAGHVANLNPEMEADSSVWKNEFFSRAIAVNEFLPDNEFKVEPGIYGVPLDVMNIQMLYNKDLLKEAGIKKPPKTWEEFLAAGAKLKERGIQGLVSGWGEVWMIDCFASNYAFNIMGEDKVMQTIKGEITYTDPDWVSVFALFKEMADNGLLYNGIVTMVNKTAEQLFANNKAAFAFNGSWCVNVYAGMNPNLNYGAMFPPSHGIYPLKIWGGAGSSLLVNNRSLVKNEAIEFLKWLSSPEQQAYLADATKNLPANKNCLAKISPILSEFSAAMEETTHPNIWPVHEFPQVIEAFDKGIQAIIIGEKTAQQVAEDVQKIKERELAKKNKS